MPGRPLQAALAGAAMFLCARAAQAEPSAPPGPSANAAAKPAGALAALPARVQVAPGATIVLPVPAGATFLAGGDAASARREADSLVVTGIRPGLVPLFILEGAESKVVLVNVGRLGPAAAGAAATRREAQPPDRASAERDLRLRTGGLVSLWTLQLAYYGSDAQVDRHASLLLRGDTKLFSYALSGTLRRPTVAGRDAPLLFSKSGTLRAGPVRLEYGATPVSSLLSARVPGYFSAATLSVDVGRFLGQASIAGADRPEWAALRPSALSVSGRVRLPADFALQAGSLLALRTGPLHATPFVGASFAGKALSASATVGALLAGGEPRVLGSAQLAARVGDCRLQGGWSSGAPGADSAEFAPFLAPMANLFLVGAGCRGRQLSFYAGGRRDMTLAGGTYLTAGAAWERPLWLLRGDANAYLDGAGLAAPTISAALRRSLGAARIDFFAWSTLRYDDFSTQATARCSRRVGFAEVALEAGAARFAGGLVQAGPSASIGVARDGFGGSLSGSAWFGADARLQSARVSGAVSWRPFPAYVFQAGGGWAPFPARTWHASAGFTYSLGDDMPREPLLAWAHARRLEAEVFEDLDGDGVRDPDEGPLAGVEICAGDRPCAKTGSSGTARLDDLPEAYLEVRARPGLEALVPTTEARRVVLVGGFRAAAVSFGFRFRGRLRITAFVDADGDGKPGPGERLLRNGVVNLKTPQGETQLTLPDGAGDFEFHRRGAYQLTVDSAALPPGYVANGHARVALQVDEFKTVPVELGIGVLRSVSGRVCLDENRNGGCEPAEPAIGLVHVAVDHREKPTDIDGAFFFSRMPPGRWELSVPELELPGGLVQKKPVVVTLPDGPIAVKDVSLPLVREKKARRRTAVLVEWPGVGATSALEIGGYLADAAPLRAPAKVPKRAKGARGPAPEPKDAARILELVKLLEQKDTALFVAVSRDPALAELAADEDARAIVEAFVKWLSSASEITDESLVVEVTPPAGPRPRLNLRVMRRRR